MKLALVAALLLASAGAHAQIAVDSRSETNTQTSSAAGANNAGVVLRSENVFEGSDHMKYDYGTQRVEQVAPLSLGGAAAGFSNENCANTTQGGVATMWFSAAKGNAKESIRCNARRDAGVYTALGDSSDAHHEGVMGAKLRAMARWKMCTATAADAEACKLLGILPANEVMHLAPEQDNSAQGPGISSDMGGAPSIDKARVTRDSGWIEPRHNQ